ncbi:CU044_2847 family protein [Kitasatospora sp. NPDC056076]|uniref:CU044_2847 family protein n=1 Tax=Kitasatospora sp. NPDC056076 TaxID=3345703 RepID=UPI0035DE026B
MSDLVRVETPDGGTFWARVEDEGGPRDVAFRGLTYRLDDLTDTLHAVVGSVRSGLRAAAPDEFTLEFGIELSVKSGLLVSAVAGSSGKASLKVSATWKKDEGTTATVRPEAEEEETEEAESESESEEPKESGPPAAATD